MTGSAGRDRLNGRAGDDTLSGGVNNDVLRGGGGTDILHGNAGNDTLTGPPNDLRVDTLNGGAGSDTCQGPGPDGDTLVQCNPSGGFDENGLSETWIRRHRNSHLRRTLGRDRGRVTEAGMLAEEQRRARQR